MEQIGHNSTGLVHRDDSWTCKRCGWAYPNVHPSAKHRRNHRKHCGKIEGFGIRQNASSHQGGSSDDASSDDDNFDNPDSKPSSRHDPMKNGIASVHSISKESIPEKSEEHTAIEENPEASAIWESEASKLAISNKPINTTQNEEINEGVVLDELQKPLESKPLTSEGEDTTLVKQDNLMYRLEPECTITAEKEEKPTCIENGSGFVEPRKGNVNTKPVLDMAESETLQSATVINSVPDAVITEKAGKPHSTLKTAIVASSAVLTESKEAVLPKEFVVSEKDEKETGLGMVQSRNEEILLEKSGISPEKGSSFATLEGFENSEVGTVEIFSDVLSHRLSGEEDTASVKHAMDLNDKLESYSQVLESSQNEKERWDKSVTPEGSIVGHPKEAENESEQINGATITTPEVVSNHFEQSTTIEQEEEKDLMKNSAMQAMESIDKEKIDEVPKQEITSVGIAEFLVSKVKEVVSGKDVKEICGFEKAQEKLNLSSSPQVENESEQLNGATITTPEVGSNHYEQSAAIEQEEEKALMRDSVIQVTESTNKQKVDEVLKPETTSVGKAEEMPNLSSSPQSENKPEQLNGATRTTLEMGSNHHEQSAAIELQEEKDLMRESAIQEMTESTNKDKLDEVSKLEANSMGKAEEMSHLSCSPQAKNEIGQLNRATKTTSEVGLNCCERSAAIEQEEKALLKDSSIQVTESTDKGKLDEVPKPEVASGGHEAFSEASSSQENNTVVQPERMQSQTAEVKPKAVRLRSSRLSKSSSTQDELDSYFDAEESFGTLDGYESLDDFYSDPSGKEDTLLSLQSSVDKASTEPVSIHLDEVKAPSSKAWEEHIDGNGATKMEQVDGEKSSKKLHTPLHSLLGEEPTQKEETNVPTTKGDEQGVQGHLASPPTSTKSKTRSWSLWKHCICCPAVR